MARRANGQAGRNAAAVNGKGTSWAELEKMLGYRFKRPELLSLAFTHRSFVYDSAGKDGDTTTLLADPSQDNEQLEFIGDAALGLLAAEALCRRFPASREGELTQLRASVVSRKYLGDVGTRLGLGRWLRLGQTAEKNDGRSNPALFANAVEALIAALYLDGGIEAARSFVEQQVLAEAFPKMERSLAREGGFSGVVGDHKSALQEKLQAEGRAKPEYRVLEETGPDHRRVFRVEVLLTGKALAEAQGSTKKQAQQEAAKLAIAVLEGQGR